MSELQRGPLKLRTFGEDFQIKELPGDKRDYHDMLHALLKVLGMQAGSDDVRIALAQWTRGVMETDAGSLILADVERQLKLNTQGDLKALWEWYDRLPHSE